MEITINPKAITMAMPIPSAMAVAIATIPKAITVAMAIPWQSQWHMAMPQAIAITMTNDNGNAPSNGQMAITMANDNGNHNAINPKAKAITMANGNAPSNSNGNRNKP